MDISAAQARRVALAAQGFGKQGFGRQGTGGGRGPVGTRQLNLALQRLAVLQIDSVNVFERSHYLPLFARLGAYDKALLDRLTLTRRAPYVEYWAHQAAFIPVEAWPLWQWHREVELAGTGKTKRWDRTDTRMTDFLLNELAEKGPLPASKIEHEATKRSGPWWGWSEVKSALETMFFDGRVVVAGRKNFERYYDLPERRLPAHVLNTSVPRPDAIRELVRQAGAALGVATVRDLADYWRLLQADTRAAVAELVDSGDLVPVRVEGWASPAYLHRDARIPRRLEGMALLSPFDPVVWARARTERMFGFRYRIEIYTPGPRRQYGYYTLPVLQDEALVGRIDLKSDRQNRALRVQSAWVEARHSPDVPRIAQLLRETAAWQGLEGLVVQRWGDLAPALAAELGAPLVERAAAEPAAAEPGAEPGYS
ncbi:winged helix-turn-helix domain-containing protein [soil metagenome]